MILTIYAVGGFLLGFAAGVSLMAWLAPQQPTGEAGERE